MPTHSRDLARVAAHLGVERFAGIGWSMGVQVLLELYETRPELLGHLVLINGTYGKQWMTSALPLVNKVLPRLARSARRFDSVGTSLVKRATDQPETVMWLKRLGLVSSTLDEELFREIADEFSGLDMGLYLDMLRALGEHDAARIPRGRRHPHPRHLR